MPKGLNSIIINCDEHLEAIMGKKQVAVPEMMKLLWAYIKEHDLKEHPLKENDLKEKKT